MKNFLIGTICLFVMVGCTGTEETAEGTPEQAEAAAPAELGSMETASMVTCEKCNTEVPEDHAEIVDGMLVCEHCNPNSGDDMDMGDTEAMVSCDKCGMEVMAADAEVIDGQTLCSHCL